MPEVLGKNDGFWETLRLVSVVLRLRVFHVTLEIHEKWLWP